MNGVFLQFFEEIQNEDVPEKEAEFPVKDAKQVIYAQSNKINTNYNE